jgi:glycosyltransferase involved in cell wall biosynthesis
VLQAADVFLLLSDASAREGLPFALLEAAASGLRLVAARGSGVDDLVKGIGGIVTNPEPGAVALAILSAMSDHDVSAARGWAVQHDLRVVAEAHQRTMLAAVEAKS